ncbi:MULTISPECIES: nitrate reductase molybdenum cofactor assembly chaperone [unclassified Actinomyces]|uniref:nitrate reductase molybdenum cofactor assembly chaperone n=1 Tax=unclassified Actinomyces TaxID=2609248 RepID=UPI0020171D3F|nr:MULTISPECIES: nitrate reductase molybdenum cofactor assembly chaperone [unclassified Actinomyces]MCL3778511.1 nitrate reductase molybdenum cofactor assembly chaperone [Actinomyces sp. AC-20-1]MCL3790145.1 nitrate reductase molybdenum cofactor assembly chaperone [Actinomyces sp. 187325]MCL3792351.1 nitrate reductase molybdenum cofactor assembly chaperone [Actinomyces sp. 186855]MCL3794932.1 nitrate reductase molybdenum cofactor assembly chaperone [Actinomyces sp. 217892]
MTTFVRAPRAAVPLEPVTPVEVTAPQRATTHMVASLLLDYPAEDTFADRLEACAAALAAEDDSLPPEPVAAALRGFIDTARERGQRAMAEHYVATFDQHRRCCLYLTYYAVGDTRHRGAAILAFKQALAAAGYEMTGDELPDYLPVVLELSARSGDEVAEALLSSHREGIEVLRAALADASSPYTRLVEAVSMTLPEIDEATAGRIRALVSAGPPTETVGVTETLPFPSTPVTRVPGTPAWELSQESRP